MLNGEFRPGGMEREWCDANVLRVLRRRSLAAMRHEIEPVDAATFARFLPAWQGVGRGRRGLDTLVETLEQLQGVAIPASVLERDILPARVEGYRPSMLDELCAAGEIVWVGAGPLGADDGRVRIYFRDRIRLLAPGAGRRRASRRTGARRAPCPPRGAGASFWPDLVAAAGTVVRTSEAPLAAQPPPRRAAEGAMVIDDSVVLTALWDLVWAGEVTNDTFGPLRVPRRTRASARRAPSPTSRGCPASGRPRARVGGRWSRRCSSPRRAAPRSRTRRRCNCSNGTAW